MKELGEYDIGNIDRYPVNYILNISVVLVSIHMKNAILRHKIKVWLSLRWFYICNVIGYAV